MPESPAAAFHRGPESEAGDGIDCVGALVAGAAVTALEAGWDADDACDTTEDAIYEGLSPFWGFAPVLFVALGHEESGGDGKREAPPLFGAFADGGATVAEEPQSLAVCDPLLGYCVVVTEDWRRPGLATGEETVASLDLLEER